MLQLDPHRFQQPVQTSVGDKLGGIFHIGDPAATNGIWDTTAKRNFRSVSGSRWDQTGSANGVLTEAGFRGILENLYIASGVDSTYRMFSRTKSPQQRHDSLEHLMWSVEPNQDSMLTSKEPLSLSQLSSSLPTLERWSVCRHLNLNRTSGSAPTTVSKRSGVLIPEGDVASIAQTMQGITFKTYRQRRWTKIS